MKKWNFALLAAAALVATVSAPVRAQTLPATPQPESCAATPITIAQLQELVASGAPAAATPSSPAQLTDATKSGIIATVEGSVACVNANQPLRELAFFTARYLFERFTGPGQDDLGHLAVAVTRSPSPAAEADRLALVSIDQFTLLPDGRVSARVATANRDQTFTDTLIFANVSGRWLIDEVASEQPAPATPIA